MEEERGSEGGVLRFVRGCIYNRWFYAFLAAVSILDVVTDVWDILNPSSNYAWDVLSLVASGVVAVLTTTIFLDLQFRRAKQ